MDKQQKKYPIEIVQQKEVMRITLKNLFADIIRAFNLEKGILRTIVGLAKYPGETIRHFLYEGRFIQFHPVRFLLVSTAISLFVFLAIDGQEAMQEAFAPPTGLETEEDASRQQVFREVFGQMFYDYFNMLIWMFIPVISIFSYLFFRKTSKLNYAENLVANTYIICFGNLINIVAYCFSFIWSVTTTSMVATAIYIIYNVYAYLSLFRNKYSGTAETIVKGILAILLGYFVYIMIFSFFIGIAVGIKLAGMEQ
ncbi:MAG: DUF3667 domain-containing protein [Bacteroidota bacterium]